MHTFEQRLQACEENNASLRRQLARQRTLWLFTTFLVAGGGAIAGGALKPAVFDSITAKEVAVVDAKGIVRARLGGDLPDGVMAGGRVAKRGSKAGGLIIYDEEGIERGGYVTMDEGSNALLTLDSKYRQAAWFIAAPDASQVSSLRMWNADGSVELRTDGSGSRISVADKQGVQFQQPSLALVGQQCSYYKKLEQENPGKNICTGRFTAAACKTCMDSK